MVAVLSTNKVYGQLCEINFEFKKVVYVVLHTLKGRRNSPISGHQ